MGFETPQTPQDGLVVELFKKYGLPETPSLEQIEPIAKELWTSPSTKLDALELILCRRVGASEIQQDPDLKALCLLQDADQAFGGLLFYRAIDQMEQSVNQ